MKHGKLLFLITILFLAACGNGIDENMSQSMADFEFTTQDEVTLNLDDLEGEWWVTNLVYTNCTTICPRTTFNLAHVQRQLKQDGLSPQIVSFSINPSFDTPEILKDYAKEHDVDEESWDFLTGYDFETIQDISENTFKSVLEKGALGQMSHGYGFYLVNPEGMIVKKYDGMSTNELNALVEDLNIVLSNT